MSETGMYPIGDDEHAAKSREQAWPWCDTCKRPAVGGAHGLRHSTSEHPFGSPKQDFDHEVTLREWWATRLRGGSNR